MKSAGECMKDARRKAGLTLNKLEMISGVPRQTIMNVENDRSGGHLHTICILADALKIGLDEYIGREIPR